MSLFKFQYTNNAVYQEFCNYLKVNTNTIENISQIPFLPIEFFKTHAITTGSFKEEQVFLSSGTTGQNQSKHLVKEVSLYEQSYLKAFQQFYGNIKDYCVLALLIKHFKLLSHWYYLALVVPFYMLHSYLFILQLPAQNLGHALGILLPKYIALGLIVFYFVNEAFNKQKAYQENN